MQALTLGRTTNNPKALSMFLVETRCQQSGRLNGIELVKLKNKLGTRQLPTAELILDGCRARIISEEGKGVSTISNMLNITRLHNIIMSVAVQRKVLNLARDYSHRRIGEFPFCIENVKITIYHLIYLFQLLENKLPNTHCILVHY